MQEAIFSQETETFLLLILKIFAWIACVLILMRFLSPLKRSCFMTSSNSIHPRSFSFMLGTGEKNIWYH